MYTSSFFKKIIKKRKKKNRNNNRKNVTFYYLKYYPREHDLFLLIQINSKKITLLRKYRIRLQLIGIKCPSPRVSENIQCQTLSELVHSQEDDTGSESCGEAKPKQEPGEMPVAQEEQTKVGGEREGATGASGDGRDTLQRGKWTLPSRPSDSERGTGCLEAQTISKLGLES